MPSTSIYQLRARWMEKTGKSLQEAEKLERAQLQAELKEETKTQTQPQPKAKPRPIVNLKRLQNAVKAKIAQCQDEMMLLQMLKSFDV